MQSRIGARIEKEQGELGGAIVSISFDQFDPSENRRVATYWPKREAFPREMNDNLQHNQMVDPEYQYVIIEDQDFERILDPNLQYADTLSEVFAKATLDEVRSNLLRFAYLYRFGGWFFEAPVFLTRSLEKYESFGNVLLTHQDDQLCSKLVMKSEIHHELLNKVLNGIAENYIHKLHFYDVEWFSGRRLLTAMASHHYQNAVQLFTYEEEVNFPGCVFATDQVNKSRDWNILQSFGVIKGLAPDFSTMPKRISMSEASLIVKHVQTYDQVRYLDQLKVEHPIYFEHRELEKLRKAAD